MASMYKYKVMIIIKEKGISKTLYPVIEASSETEAKKIAKAQFLSGEVKSASKISS
jgi:hypothetical protein